MQLALQALVKMKLEQNLTAPAIRHPNAPKREQVRPHRNHPPEVEIDGPVTVQMEGEDTLHPATLSPDGDPLLHMGEEIEIEIVYRDDHLPDHVIDGHGMYHAMTGVEKSALAARLLLPNVWHELHPQSL